MGEGDHPVPAEQPAAPAVQAVLPPGYQVGGIHLENSPGAQVHVGGSTMHQQTWVQQLIAKHGKWYWFVHFLIGLLAAIIVEIGVWLIHRQ